ncbi:MFS family permease [Salirhabdus euzebyi]|uniref:MFS family permease n=1 Tax=Salirhabdus euzebyi TaxID=394506 RepID=A0A841Q6D7_9BACI|nr:MFS transporter [Salirhabdus euzebyi]MBB6454079.1 MFS family permease [Salirhabdus euzebyi]
MELSLHIFRNKNFLLYFIIVWVSSLGDSIFIIALTWLLVEMTGSPLIVGSYLFAVGITKMIFVLFGGVIVDRVDARKLLVLSNIIRALMMFIFLMFIMFGLPPLWLFYVVGVLFGAVDSIAEPAGISCRKRIVKEEHYTQSMSLLMVASNSSYIIGPMIGATLIAFGGMWLAILVNGLSFVLVVILFMFISFRVTDEEEIVSKSFIKSLLEGFKYFVKTPVIVAMSTQAFITNASVGAAMISIPFLIKKYELGVESYGLIHTFLGIGSAIGALLFIVFTIKRPKPYMVLITVFIQGALIMLIGFSHQLIFLAIMFLFIGVQESAINVLAPSVNQTIIPNKMFGRVIGIMILIMGSSTPISQALSGWLMESLKPEIMFVGAGILQMSGAIATYLVPAVRNFGK